MKTLRSKIVIPLAIAGAIAFALLAFPLSRALISSQFAGSGLVPFSFWPRGNSNSENLNEASPDVLAAARRAPDDISVLALAAAYVPDVTRVPPFSPSEYDPSMEEPDARRIAQNLDRLLAREPKNLWLLTRRLNASLQWMGSAAILRAQAAPPSAPDEDGPGRNSKSAPEPVETPGIIVPRYVVRPKFTLKELNATINLARRAQKLEPDNAFFDWSLARLLLLGLRDEEAIRALESGAKKTRFDVRSRETNAAYARVWELQLKRRMTPLKKLQWLENETASSRLTHNGANPFLPFARQARKSGDHQMALRIYNSLLRLGVLQMRAPSFAESDHGRNGIDGVFKEFPNAKNGKAAARLSAFLLYARKHGRAFEEKKVRAIEAQSDAQFSLGSKRRQTTNTLGVPDGAVKFVEFCHVVGVLLLLICAGALGSGALASWRAGSTPGGSNPVPRIERVDVRDAILACWGVGALGSALLAAFILLELHLSVAIAFGESDNAARALAFFWRDLKAFDAQELLRDLVLHVYRQSNEINFCFGLFLTPLFLGILFCARRAWRRARGAKGFDFRAAMRQSARIFRSDFDFDFARVVLDIIEWMARLAIIGAWVVLIFIVLHPIANAWAAFASLLILLGVGGANSWVFRLKNPAAGALATRLLARALLSCAAAWGVLLLTLLLISLPFQTRLDEQTDLIFKHGEVEALRRLSR